MPGCYFCAEETWEIRSGNPGPDPGPGDEVRPLSGFPDRSDRWTGEMKTRNRHYPFEHLKKQTDRQTDIDKNFCRKNWPSHEMKVLAKFCMKKSILTSNVSQNYNGLNIGFEISNSVFDFFVMRKITNYR